MQAKPNIRRQGREQREAMGPGARAELDGRIVTRCMEELDWGSYRRVMVFLPIERRHEINTWPLVEWIFQIWPSVNLYVPRVVGDELEAVRITPESKFSPDRWGIPEPEGGAGLATHDALDLVLTPLLGFDGHGQRVGYGRGYYDRFFSAHPTARRVGLGYECLLVENGIPAEPHDRPLHDVITEEQRYAVAHIEKS